MPKMNTLYYKGKSTAIPQLTTIFPVIAIMVGIVCAMNSIRHFAKSLERSFRFTVTVRKWTWASGNVSR